MASPAFTSPPAEAGGAGGSTGWVACGGSGELAAGVVAAVVAAVVGSLGAPSEGGAGVTGADVLAAVVVDMALPPPLPPPVPARR